jgi:hypothetical protein
MKCQFPEHVTPLKEIPRATGRLLMRKQFQPPSSCKGEFAV